MSNKILIVDDEDIVVRSCTRILGNSYEIDSASDGRTALEKIADGAYDIVILDIMMPGMSGIEVLQQVKESRPEIDVIMITGLSEIETAVRAMKLGAFDYLPKPFDPDQLEAVVERALERRRLLQEDHGRNADARYRFENIIGTSPAMQQVYRLIAQCAPTNSTVLITGESGTGKELIARAIH
ncbi:MAG TPA: response regulator, partial [Burkholderiaceae bacterium]|nr:response regulator [Burkholderiaceae bacterium]